MRGKLQRLKNIFQSKSIEMREADVVPIITDDSFLDVHHHYDTNEFVYAWRNLLDSNRALWEKSLAANADGKKILIATLGGGFSHRPFITIDNILSIALTLRGAQVHQFFCDHALPICLKAEHAYIKPEVIHHGQLSQTLCKGCYKDINAVSLQIGLPHFSIGAFVNFAERKLARDIAKEIEFKAIKDFAMGGVLIGKHAIAGAMRYFAHSEPQQLPLGEEMSRRYLEASIITYLATKKVLEKNKYDNVCLTHGSYTPHGVIKETCEQMGVPITCWGVAYLHRRFTFTQGEVLFSMLHEPNDAWENMQWGERQEQKIMEYINSRWGGSKDWLSIPKDKQKYKPFKQFAEENKMDLNKPIIGLLTNIIWESYAEYKSRVFPDMLTWIEKTISYFKKRKDLQLLIRIHPAENQWHVSRQLALVEINKMFKTLPENVFIINSNENVSTYEAMEHCDSAIIYQTQTGLELATHGIPVIVTGDAFVRNKKILTEPASEEEYFSQLAQLPFKQPLSDEKILRAKKYAYHAFFRKMIPLSFLEESKDWMLFKSTLTQLDQLLPGQDEGLDIICKGLMDGTPFIYPADERDQETVF